MTALTMKRKKRTTLMKVCNLHSHPKIKWFNIRNQTYLKMPGKILIQNHRITRVLIAWVRRELDKRTQRYLKRFLNHLLRFRKSAIVVCLSRREGSQKTKKLKRCVAEAVPNRHRNHHRKILSLKKCIRISLKRRARAQV